MSSPLKIDGSWPLPVTLRRGWSKARARPWNQISDISYLRLLRGGSGFISDATDWLEKEGGNPVLSPALYPSATRVWADAGYEPSIELLILEKILDQPGVMAPGITKESRPDLAALESLDRAAFDAFWHMDRRGLDEAIRSTSAGITLIATAGADIAGYAVVGTQLATAFLQRIAVNPVRQREGWGQKLIDATIEWAFRRGASVLTLNVRPDNQGAIDLYLRSGFVDTGNYLHVLQHGGVDVIA